MCVCVLIYPYHKPWYHLTLRQAEAATALPSLVTLASSALAGHTLPDGLDIKKMKSSIKKTKTRTNTRTVPTGTFPVLPAR
eukprot:COSAG01_NODE_35433_length_531_cov_25.150463_1_plen_80_part_01